MSVWLPERQAGIQAASSMNEVLIGLIWIFVARHHHSLTMSQWYCDANDIASDTNSPSRWGHPGSPARTRGLVNISWIINQHEFVNIFTNSLLVCVHCTFAYQINTNLEAGDIHPQGVHGIRARSLARWCRSRTEAAAVVGGWGSPPSSWHLLLHVKVFPLIRIHLPEETGARELFHPLWTLSIA